MPKYLLHVNYTLEGIKGVLSKGGTARKAAAQAAAESAGGTLEAMYFAFGDTDVFAVADLPDNAAAAALAVRAQLGRRQVWQGERQGFEIVQHREGIQVQLALEGAARKAPAVVGHLDPVRAHWRRHREAGRRPARTAAGDDVAARVPPRSGRLVTRIVPAAATAGPAGRIGQCASAPPPAR